MLCEIFFFSFSLFFPFPIASDTLKNGEFFLSYKWKEEPKNKVSVSCLLLGLFWRIVQGTGMWCPCCFLEELSQTIKSFFFFSSLSPPLVHLPPPFVKLGRLSSSRELWYLNTIVLSIGLLFPYNVNIIEFLFRGFRFTFQPILQHHCAWSRKIMRSDCA